MSKSTRGILDTLVRAINPADPTPIYHQVAAVVRWELARGRLHIGTLLPPIREVATALGVNYHTVRRAWSDLEAEGVVTLRQGRGARLVRAPSGHAGWRPDHAAAEDEDEAPVVWVVDASLERASRLAERIAGRWLVRAVPYPLDPAPPPPGPILLLGSAFTGDSLPWPSREGDSTRIEPVLDPITVTVIRRNARVLDAREVVLVHGSGDPHQPVQELLRQLPRLGLRVRSLQAPTDALDPGRLWLHMPASWRALDWEARSRPDVMAAEFDWAPGPLAGVARRLGWRAR